MTVTDFLVTEMTLYSWFAILVVVLAIAGVAWWSVFLAHGVVFVSDWSAKKREAWRYKTWVMRELREHPDGADPPEYEHPDGDDELLEWDQDTAADERWGQDMADLAEVLRLAHEAGYLDDIDLRRCDNEDCGLHGMLHNGPCDVPEEEAKVESYDAEFAEAGGYGPHRTGAAMPPQPVREFLHPAIMDDLKARGFSEHETNDGALDSMFTHAEARVIQAMIKEEGQEDGRDAD